MFLPKWYKLSRLVRYALKAKEKWLKLKVWLILL